MSGPLPAVLRPLTVPLSWAYGGAVGVRNRRYDRGRGIVRVPVPVISVGNLTAGGTGKTPLVRWIAARLRAHGHRPLVALRGHRVREGAGDEAAEYARLMPEVDLAVGADRVAALGACLPGHPEVDCVLLDDGFQHRRLYRQLDLVLIDATRPGLEGPLLPAGWLREPAASLRRAGAVLVTRAPVVLPALERAIARHHGAAPLAWSRHVWPYLTVFEPARASRREDPAWLRGRAVVAVLGVGNPAAVLGQLRGAGAEIVGRVRAGDHQHYTDHRLQAVRRRAEGTGAGAVVFTGKDWVKVRGRIDLTRWPAPIVVPELEIDLFRGAGPLMSRVLAAVGDRP